MMTGFPLPLKTTFRKRKREDDEEDNQDDPYSKKNMKDQAFQDPHAIEVGVMATQLLHLTHCPLCGIRFHLNVGKRILPDTLMKVISMTALILRQSRIFFFQSRMLSIDKHSFTVQQDRERTHRDVFPSPTRRNGVPEISSPCK